MGSLPYPLAARAAKHMDVRTPARALKEAADEDIAASKQNAADGAHAISVSADAVKAAPNVHEAVFAAV